MINVLCCSDLENVTNSSPMKKDSLSLQHTTDAATNHAAKRRSKETRAVSVSEGITCGNSSDDKEICEGSSEANVQPNERIYNASVEKTDTCEVNGFGIEVRESTHDTRSTHLCRLRDEVKIIKFEEGSSLAAMPASYEASQIQLAYGNCDASEFASSAFMTGSRAGGDEPPEANCGETFHENLLASLSTENLASSDILGTDSYDSGEIDPLVLPGDNEICCLEKHGLKVESGQNGGGVTEFCPEAVKIEAINSETNALLNRTQYFLLPTNQMPRPSFDSTSSSAKKKHPCHICGKLLTKKAIKSHARTHTGERPFKCDICSMSFTLAANLYRHRKLHSGDKSYLCHHCGKEFIQNVTLQDHLTMHQDEKKFKCNTCGELFAKSKQLTQHNNEFHRVESKPPVQERPAETSSSSNFQRPVLCDLCGKGFANKFGLKQHVKLHLQDKPYKCSYCEKSFLTKQNLSQHILNHTGEKPYICNLCGMAYKRKHLLMWHEARHAGLRPYTCETCGKDFGYSCSLTVHMRTHTGERPYKCKQCGSAYSQSNHLKVHTRTHTGEKPFICQYCEKSYKNRLDLRLHSIRVHQINITKSRSAATNNNWQ